MYMQCICNFISIYKKKIVFLFYKITMNQEFKMHISPPSFLHCFCRSLDSVGLEWYNNGREMNANTKVLG